MNSSSRTLELGLKPLTPPYRNQTMTAGLKLLTVSVLLVVSACVSVGTKAITDAGCVSQIEVGKSTQADVTALLGYPITASYGSRGEETWYYAWITAYPTAFAFVPVVKAVAPLGETTREFAVTFSPDGTVKSLGVTQPHKSFSPSG
jgi:outer membrane protein assembly factor BamE (lipoprotein component of BamABCDE complex)